jgi:hypothetical protein
MFFRSSTFLLAAAAVFLSGCVAKPQLPVNLAPTALKTGKQRIGVAMTQLPKVEVHLPGASCLLCIMTATAANSSLSKHASSLALEDLAGLKDKAATALRQNGSDTVVINEPLDIKALLDSSASTPNAAKKDFAPLKQKYGIDMLLVIDINALGFERMYSAYFPTSDPKGLLRGTGYLVNLSTNTYEWYLPVNVAKSADGKWDEPTTFPGLTNAYYQALEIGKDAFIQPLALAK